jgi:hypothetical protein
MENFSQNEFLLALRGGSRQKDRLRKEKFSEGMRITIDGATQL